MTIKGIGFDIDGTLYNNNMMLYCTLLSFIKHPRLGYHFGRTRTAIRKVRPINDFKETQAAMVAEGMGISRERAAEFIEKRLFEDWETRFSLIRPLPGLEESLITLRTAGYRLGLMSDFPLQSKLKYLGLEDWDCAFTAEETCYLKPHPEPFYELAKRLDFAPEEILYVGNSYSKDIVGAARVGMKTAHYSMIKKTGSIADITFSSYSTLPGLIESAF